VAIAPIMSEEIQSDTKILFIFPLHAGTMARHYSEADSAEHLWQSMRKNSIATPLQGSLWRMLARNSAHHLTGKSGS
jgi:hypothetical protein